MKIRVGDQAPEFILPAIDGTDFDVSSTKGKRVIFTFFRFSTCPFCNIRINRIIKRWDEFSDEVQMIGVFDAEIEELKSRRTSIGILAIIFGFLGVHKFMLGYKREGFILLVVSIIGGVITCGIAIIVTDIIGIIEGIMILNKTPMQFKKTYIDRKTFWFQ